MNDVLSSHSLCASSALSDEVLSRHGAGLVKWLLDGMMMMMVMSSLGFHTFHRSISVADFLSLEILPKLLSPLAFTLSLAFQQ